MSLFIVIEGIDGSGKQTLTEGLTQEWRSQGLSVANTAFPRYEYSLYANFVQEALHGAHGDLADSVYGMGLLYALDRKQARLFLAHMRGEADIVLCDRYVASNAAYGAARLHEDTAGPYVSWVRELEFSRFAVPVPDLQVLLDVHPEVAGARIQDRARDSYERDGELQQRVGDLYRQLAAQNWMSQWRVVDATARQDLRELAGTLYAGADAAQ